MLKIVQLNSIVPLFCAAVLSITTGVALADATAPAAEAVTGLR